jgi:hypothetical protein
MDSHDNFSVQARRNRVFAFPIPRKIERVSELDFAIKGPVTLSPIT